MNLFKYALHFSIFSLILLALPLTVHAKGDILEGTVKASYSIYEDNSLSYTLNFEIQNNDTSKYMTSFQFSVPFKEYSALNVTATNLADYDVLPGEYNFIELHFTNPIEYLNRSSVSVNITVPQISINPSGNPEIDLINPVTGENVNYTINAPTNYGNLVLSQNIQKSLSVDNDKNITTFASTDNLRMVWRKENLYSFRLKYQVTPLEGSEALINLPLNEGNKIYYSKLLGVYSAVFDGIGNSYGVAGAGGVDIEFQVDTNEDTSSESRTETNETVQSTLTETKYLDVNKESNFYKSFTTELHKDLSVSEMLMYLDENISLNRGYKVSRDNLSDLWKYLEEGRELNSFEASFLIHSVLMDNGIRSELRFGYIVDPFEINFPIAWVETEEGTIDMFSHKYLNNDNVTKVVFGIWNDNEDDQALGVFSDTPEVVRIEPITALEIDRTTTGITLTSGSTLEAINASAKILKISKLTINDQEVSLIVNGYNKALLPGTNILGASTFESVSLETEDGQSASLQSDTNLSGSSEQLQTTIKTAILAIGTVVILVLVFFVKRNPTELKFEEQS